jgi:aerobic-type carbon monoxide dehydrogenase small subunit (CoxS/CutS family)
MSEFSLSINGAVHTVEAEPDMPLLWVLRDLLNLTGTKFSCGIGACGACTVLIDEVAVRSCLTPVSTTAGKQITTIEGLSADGNHPLQRAWIDHQVAQCGYCQPGQIMTAAALLAANPDPSEEDIRAAMTGTLCRCGMYGRIQAAVQQAAGELEGVA